MINAMGLSLPFFAYLASIFRMFSRVSSLVEYKIYPKFLECSSQITNFTSRIAVIVQNPVSKCTFCFNLMNFAFMNSVNLADHVSRFVVIREYGEGVPISFPLGSDGIAVITAIRLSL